MTQSEKTIATPVEAEGHERPSDTGGEKRPTSPRSPWPRYEEAALGLRNYWYPAMLSRHLRTKPAPIKLLGEELMLVRGEKQVYCLQRRCAHRGVSLTEGKFEFPETITCYYHGWTYDLATGSLVAALTDGPKSPIVGKVCLNTYPAVDRQGVIWVFVGNENPPPLEEDVPKEFLDPGLTIWPRPVQVQRGNWRLGVEGGLDPSHAYYLHRFSRFMWFMRVPATRGRHWVEREGKYLTYRTETPTMEADYPGLGRWPRKKWWKREGGFVVPKVYGWLPCGVMVKDFPAQDASSFNWHVPVDEDHWINFQFQVARVGGLKKLWFKVKHFFIWGPLVQGMFLDQDRWAAEEATIFYNHQDGWRAERLMRPDVMITSWRKHVEKNAREFQMLDDSTGKVQE